MGRQRTERMGRESGPEPRHPLCHLLRARPRAVDDRVLVRRHADRNPDRLVRGRPVPDDRHRHWRSLEPGAGDGDEGRHRGVQAGLGNERAAHLQRRRHDGREDDFPADAEDDRARRELRRQGIRNAFGLCQYVTKRDRDLRFRRYGYALDGKPAVRFRAGRYRQLHVLVALTSRKGRCTGFSWGATSARTEGARPSIPT